MATARAYSALSEGVNLTTFNIPFSGTQPVAGDKIVVVFWYFTGAATAQTVSSVKDNATSQNTYTLTVSRPDDLQSANNHQGVFCYFLDLPGNATWSGNYTVTVTWSGSAGDSEGAAAAYVGSTVQLGNATATNNATNAGGATNNAANSGNITPTGSGLYIGGETDTQGAGATFTPGSGFTNEASQTNGASFQTGVFSDLVEGSGTKSANWTLGSAVIWSAIVAFFPDASSATQNPFSTRMRMQKGIQRTRRVKAMGANV